MLAPVVMEGWRNKPWTGLLSGDDLSIPGGVKPKRENKTKFIQDKQYREKKIIPTNREFPISIILSRNIQLKKILK